MCLHTLNRLSLFKSQDSYVMIVKKKDGYYVVSKEGKNLGGPYSSRLGASRRLKQVEYFKGRG